MGVKRVTVEDVGDDFRVRWSVDGLWADVEVYEIMGREEGGSALFQGAGTDGPGEAPESGIDQAQRHMHGFLQSDGCCQFWFDDEPLHLCGADSWQGHVDLMRYLWARAYELMGREPPEDWPEAEAARGKRGVIVEGSLAPAELPAPAA